MIRLMFLNYNLKIKYSKNETYNFNIFSDFDKLDIRLL